MKINDFKPVEKRLDEFRLSSVLGDYGSAAAKKMFGMSGGKTMKQQMAQDIFLKDFVGDAISAIQSGIKGGLIDPNLSSDDTDEKEPVDPGSVKPAPGQPGAVPPAPAAQQAPQQGQAPGAPAAKPNTSKAVGNYQKQVQQTQNMNQYIQGASKAINATQDKAQKIALTKELVNYMADRKGYPEWENGLATVNQVIKKGNVDPNFANAALAKIKAGQTMAEAWKIFYINKLVEAVGLSWRDLGLTVLKESRSKKYYITETKYLKLNNLFESILAEAAESLESYLTRWFDQYMKGVSYDKAQMAPMIKAVADTYARDKGKAALEKLGHSAYAVSKGMVPVGAQNAAPQSAPASTPRPAPAESPAQAQTQQPQAAAQPQTQSQPAQAEQDDSYVMGEKIKKDLSKLSQVDPTVYNQLIKQLQPAPEKKEAPEFQDKASTNNPQMGQKVAESKRKIKRT